MTPPRATRAGLAPGGRGWVPWGRPAAGLVRDASARAAAAGRAAGAVVRGGYARVTSPWAASRRPAAGLVRGASARLASRRPPAVARSLQGFAR